MYCWLLLDHWTVHLRVLLCWPVSREAKMAPGLFVSEACGGMHGCCVGGKAAVGRRAGVTDFGALRDCYTHANTCAFGLSSTLTL